MPAYYNEIDPYPAAWLRNLIAAGHLPAGDVDERSIVDVRADDLRRYIQCHFFAGIGGWPYALRLVGWPDHRPVWTGSCPCQPLSSAGQRRGHADERHLWPAFHSLIAQRRPAIVLGEQVASADGREWLAGVRADLEGLGYAVGGADLCAASVGAPHIRQRLWWVADADGRLAGNGNIQPGRQHGQQPQDDGAGGMEHAASDGREQRRPEPDGRGAIGGCGLSRLGNTDDARPQGRREQPDERAAELSAWASGQPIDCTDGKARRVEPGIFPLAHGVSGRVGRLRAYGNAIVPQVAAQFIVAVMECRP